MTPAAIPATAWASVSASQRGGGQQQRGDQRQHAAQQRAADADAVDARGQEEGAGGGGGAIGGNGRADGERVVENDRATSERMGLSARPLDPTTLTANIRAGTGLRVLRFCIPRILFE